MTYPIIKRTEALRLHGEGQSVREIARQLCVTRSPVYRWLSQAKPDLGKSRPPGPAPGSYAQGTMVISEWRLDDHGCRWREVRGV